MDDLAGVGVVAEFVCLVDFAAVELSVDAAPADVLIVHVEDYAVVAASVEFAFVGVAAAVAFVANATFVAIDFAKQTAVVVAAADQLAFGVVAHVKEYPAGMDALSVESALENDLRELFEVV